MSSLKKVVPRIRRNHRATEPEPSCVRAPYRFWQAGIFQPLHHVLATEGKRLRAELIELSYQIAGGSGHVPLELIEFVELLHAGTLVIDDIEDGSAVRRGQPTLHQIVGTPLAINTGNWMYFSALEKIQDLPLPPDRLMAVYQETISTIRRGHEGQALDLTAKIGQMDRSEVYPTVREISTLKTGGVTALAAKLGAALAGADPSCQRAFHAFGMHLGVGLQMQNDLVELSSGTREGGRLDDLRNARVTWPWAWLSCHGSEREFAELQDLLRQRTEDNLPILASRLLGSISTVCKKPIQHSFSQAMNCLGDELDLPSSPAFKKFADRMEAYYV